jgi:hypothetical protein
MLLQKVVTSSVSSTDTSANPTVETQYLVINDYSDSHIMKLRESDVYDLHVLLSRLLYGDDCFPEEVKKLAREGKKIDAIVALRKVTNLSLKGAKDRVESWLAKEGVRVCTLGVTVKPNEPAEPSGSESPVLGSVALPIDYTQEEQACADYLDSQQDDARPVWPEF